MNGIGKPLVLFTRSVPGAPPLLWVDEAKIEIDQETALYMGEVIDQYRAELLRAVMRKERSDG